MLFVGFKSGNFNELLDLNPVFRINLTESSITLGEDPQ